jgi:hypothetical protein
LIGTVLLKAVTIPLNFPAEIPGVDATKLSIGLITVSMVLAVEGSVEKLETIR